MGMCDQFFDIAQTVAGGGPGAKLRATNINSISTMIYGAHTTGKILGGGQ